MSLTKQEKIATSILILTLGIGMLAKMIQRGEMLFPSQSQDVSVVDSIQAADSVSLEQTKFIPLDLNRADVDELVLLPGIGPKKAQAIVEWRSRNGEFIYLEDLLKVKGIGPKTLESIRPFVVVLKPGSSSNN